MPDTPYFLAEYTQVIQTFKNGVTIPPPGVTLPAQAPNNSIPLISNKQTLVRVYLHVNDVADPALGQRFFDGEIGFFVPGGYVRFSSINGRIPAKRSFQVSRANINDSLNFLIPANYCKGQLDGIITIDDSFSGDRLGYLFRIKFTNVPLLEIHSVLVNYNGVDYFGNNISMQATGFDLLASLDYVLRTFPINGFVFDGCEILDWNVALAAGQTAPDAVEKSWYDLSAKLNDMHANSDSTSIYLGVLPEEATCAGTCGLGVYDVSALFRARETENAAHEIGHALRRPHTPCANAAAGQDESYPQYFGLPRGTIGEYGVDLKILSANNLAPNSVLDPHTTFDFMSYCPPRWMSPHTYLEIMSDVISRGSQYLSLKIASPLNKDREYQYISFRIYKTMKGENVEILNEFSISKTNPPLLAGHSEVMIELADAGGRILGSFPCNNNSPCSRSELPFETVTVWVPVMNNTSRLRISKKGQVIYEAAVAKESPKIKSYKLRAIKKEGANLMHLSWVAEIPGKKTGLLFSVRFSKDGKKWRSLLCGSTANSLIFNSDLLPGGDDCRIQIMASYGFKTSVEEIKNIKIGIKPAKAYINSPKNGETYDRSELVYFSGAGFSPDAGLSSPDGIYWTTPSKGLIGRGYQFSYGDLPVGVHTITMHLSGLRGEEVTGVVSVSIAEAKKCIDETEISLNRSIEELKSKGKMIIQKDGSTNMDDILIPQSFSPQPSGAAKTHGCGCK